MRYRIFKKLTDIYCSLSNLFSTFQKTQEYIHPWKCHSRVPCLCPFGNSLSFYCYKLSVIWHFHFILVLFIVLGGNFSCQAVVEIVSSSRNVSHL